MNFKNIIMYKQVILFFILSLMAIKLDAFPVGNYRYVLSCSINVSKNYYNTEYRKTLITEVERYRCKKMMNIDGVKEMYWNG